MNPYYSDDSVTIYHGDCREILPTLTVAAVVADPPYGINLDTDYSHLAGRDRSGTVWAGKPHERVVGDDEPFDPALLLAAAPTTVLWGANHFSARLPEVGGWLVWDKRVPSEKSTVFGDAEIAWCSWPQPLRILSHMWSGFYRASEVGVHLHPTQKPVALMRWVLNLLPTDGLICDPYMGSGPTLRAAKDLGRTAIGIEIEERYCEIAARRMGQEVLAL